MYLHGFTTVEHPVIAHLSSGYAGTTSRLDVSNGIYFHLAMELFQDACVFQSAVDTAQLSIQTGDIFLEH